MRKNPLWKRGISFALTAVMAGALVLQALPPLPVRAAVTGSQIANDSLTAQIGDLGQITSLKINNDLLNHHGNQIDFVLPNDMSPQNDTDHQWMGEMIFSTRTSDTGEFPADNTGFVEVDTNRTLAAGGSTTATNINADNPYIDKTVSEDGKKVTVNFSGQALDSTAEGVMKGFDVTSEFDMSSTDGSMVWSITLKNMSGKYIEFGDIGLPMPWNNKYLNIDDTYSNRLTVHSFAGADSGYMYAIRTSGEGNYMVFTPVPETGARIEYVDYWTGSSHLGGDIRKDETNWVGDGGGWFPGLSVCYIHSKDIWERTGRSYLAEEPTSLVLEPGESKTYSFKFSAVRAGDNSPIEANSTSLSVEERENNMRSILYDSGMIDAIAVPGFQTALNMETKLDLHYDESRITDVQVDIQCVHENDPYDNEHIPTQYDGAVSNDRGGMGAEHPVAGYTESCQLVETKVVDGESHHIYDLQFGCIGNNSVCVSYKLDGVQKYTQFEFNALAELGNMTETHSDFVLNETFDSNPESPTYGIYSDWYLGAGKNDNHWGDDWSHDNVDFMVMKNYLDPDADEIKSLETYLIDFMWENYMKYNHETLVIADFLRDSGIYTDKERPYSRTFSEIMVITAYFNMYRIMKAYPDLIDYRETPEYYLDKAYRIYMARVGAGAIGFYGEQQIPQMIEALWAEGMTEEAQALQERFARDKGTNVANAAYPYGSEFEYDNTGEEGAYAAAKALMTYYPDSSAVADAKEGMGQANMKTRAMRGIQPTWYFYADPVFRGGEGWWNFQYTASLAGYIMDDWMRYEADGTTDSTGWAARLNYAAKLSNFNAINMGQIHDESIGSVAWRFNAYKGGFGTKNVNDGWVDGVGTMRNGWNDFAGESDLGIYGSLLSISADVVTDPVFGLYGYGCNVTKNGSTYTIVPTDGFGKRINLLDEKLYVELVQGSCTEARINGDGSSIALDINTSSNKAHTVQLNLSGAGLKEGYYTVTVGGQAAGQALVSDEKAIVYASVPANGGTATITLTNTSSTNQAPTVQVSCDDADLQAIVPFTVRGTAQDDSTAAERLTYKWAVKTQPDGANVTFTDDTQSFTGVKVDKEGGYVLTLTVSDGTLSTTQELSLTVGNAPDRLPPTITEAAGVQDVTNVSTAKLSASATADPLYEGTLTYAWSVVTNAEGGNAVIANANQQNAILLADTPGNYTVRVTVTDAGKESYQDVVVTMNEATDGVQRGKTVVTQKGEAPALPASMDVITSNGSIAAKNVTWDAVPADQYQSAGSFEVKGTAEGNIAVACKVMVVNGQRKNLAPSAKASASYIAGDLGGVSGLNDGYEPANSGDTSHGVWHNWGSDVSKPGWVQYNWDVPVTIDGTDAYYFKDGWGNFYPKAVVFEYLDANGNWQPVPNPDGLGIALDQYNTTTFDPITTTAIRMTMTPGKDGSGVVEWKVYGYGDFADRTELRSILEYANGLNTDLIVSGADGLATAIAEAQKVYDDTSAQASDIDGAVAALKEAVAALEVQDGNLAYIAGVTTSYVSGWESLAAVNDGILNVGVDPAKPRYGSWGNGSAYETITYTWPVAMDLSNTKIQFWTDEGGIKVPAGYAFYQLDSNGEYQLIEEITGEPAMDTLLDTAFEGVVTTSLQVKINKPANDNNGIGVMEWQVFGQVGETPEEPGAEYGNIAPLATPTAIIDTPQDLGGVTKLNDGFNPASSADTSNGVWHNWLGGLEMQKADAWVMYTWDQPMTIDKMEAYYFQDGNQNFPPKAVVYEYLDADGTWKTLPNVQGQGVELNQYNVTTFDAVTTTSVKMTMTPKRDGSGVIEWKVYGKVAEGGEPTVSKVALEAKVQEANALVQAEYTAESWKELQTALTAANQVLSNDTATQQQVDDALSALVEAINNLAPAVTPPEVDTTALQAAIASAKALTEGNYTPESWAAMQQALAEAEAVLKDASATQDDVNAATEALNDAVKKLETKPDAQVNKDALKAAIDLALEKDKADYTLASWNRMNEALLEAQRVYADEHATQQQVNLAANTLTAAILSLEKKSWSDIILPILPDLTPDAPTFADVPETHWAHEAVSYVAGEGYFNGTGEGKFSPNATMTRAMLVTVLWRAAGEPLPTTEQTFADVPQGTWYSLAVEWAANEGIVTGTGSGFSPEAPVSREQIAAILWRMSGKPLGTGSLGAFADGSQVSGYARDAMAWAVGTGLMQGSGNQLNPKTSATRAEVAMLLYRYFEQI